MMRTLATLLLAVAALAQTVPNPALDKLALKPPAMTGKVKRGLDGKPDFNGIWQSTGVSLFGETGELRPGDGTTNRWGPPPEKAPYKPEHLAKVERLGSDDRLSPTVQCKMAGIPRATGGVTPLEIFQTPSKVAILYENNHAFRSIPMRATLPADIWPSYMGTSIARWDGDVLVVDAVGFNDQTWLPGAGNFHSEKLHVVERYHLMPNDQIYYEAIMDDPAVFTKPWTYRLILRHPPRDERILEAECDENNQDLDHIQPGKFTQR